MEKTKGQALNTTTIVMGGVMFVASWLGGFVLNSIKDSPQAVAQISERVKAIEVNDKNQDTTISDVKSDIKYIRAIVDQMAQRQGIVIKTNEINP